MMGIAGATNLPLVDPELSVAVAHEPAVYDEDKALIRSVAQGTAVAERMRSANACHLQNHGMVFTGPNVETATIEAIATEHLAELTWRAQLIGAPEAMADLALRPALERRGQRGSPGGVGALLEVGRRQPGVAASSDCGHLGGWGFPQDPNTT